MKTKQIGNAGLQGWRTKLADSVAPAVAQRSPLSEDAVRAVIGAAFLVLSVMYVWQAIKEVARA